MSIGAIIGKEFTEGGVSATTTRRPALQAMLTYLEEEARAGRPVDYVIVLKLDRLVRTAGLSQRHHNEEWPGGAHRGGG